MQCQGDIDESEAIFFSFLSSFPTGCCSFLLLSLTVGLKFYSLPTFYTFSLSLSLFILCESGIIIVQSYPSSLIRPPLLEKCSLHFPSRFYTPTDGCMNLTTVKLLLCLLAASTLWNVNLFSSYYILEVIKVSTPLFTCSFSPFLHRDRWTNNSKKATLWSSWSQLLYILSIIHLNAKKFWGKIGCTTNSIEYIQPLFRRPSLLAFLGQAQSNGFRNEAVDGPWLNLLNRRGSS